MNIEQKELLMKEKDDYSYQCFDSMMDSLFDLASDLHDKLSDSEELTDAELVFLRSFDIYIDSACELNDLEEKEITRLCFDESECMYADNRECPSCPYYLDYNSK